MHLTMWNDLTKEKCSTSFPLEHVMEIALLKFASSEKQDLR